MPTAVKPQRKCLQIRGFLRTQLSVSSLILQHCCFGGAGFFLDTSSHLFSVHLQVNTFPYKENEGITIFMLLLYLWVLLMPVKTCLSVHDTQSFVSYRPTGGFVRCFIIHPVFYSFIFAFMFNRLFTISTVHSFSSPNPIQRGWSLH